MDVLTILLCVLLLLAIATIIIIATRGSRKAEGLRKEAAARQAELQGRIEGLTAEKAAMEARLEEQEKGRKQLEEQREASLKAEREHASKALEEMRDAFKALSAENSDHFRKESADSIAELLKPVREKFKEFSDSVKTSDEKNAERSGSMEKMIRLLAEQSRNVGNQAQALADAITGQSKTQGDFGEMLLVDLLRESGLQEGVNFSVQGVIRDESGHEIKSDEGRTMIPDVIVHYPDGGEVIVDSKVSLKAFVEWNQAVLPEDRKRLAREHISSIRRHVDELRGKDYASYIPEGRKKIDYNLMFIPIENAFRLMQEEEPLLWQQAKKQGVLIVSQMSLAIVLNMILVAWRQFDQQRNIQEVFKTAGELMSALENWMGEYVKVGDKLRDLSRSYGESTRVLTESNQSVVKKILKLEKLGATRKHTNASLKSSGRMIGGRESIVPGELSVSPDEEETSPDASL